VSSYVMRGANRGSQSAARVVWEENTSWVQLPPPLLAFLYWYTTTVVNSIQGFTS